MLKPTLVDIQKLIRELVLPFYQIKRDFPLPIENHRDENDAEHSWSLAFVTCALAPKADPKLDAGKACMLAVVHDLVEVYAGDVSYWGDKKDLLKKADREKLAVKQLEANFSEFQLLHELIEEYETKQTNESLFVWALDKFLNLLVLYEDKGYYFIREKIDRKLFEKHMVTHRQKGGAHPLIAKYYQQLWNALESHPEYFYRPPKSTKT